MYCTKCGKKILQNAKFCIYCGYERDSLRYIIIFKSKLKKNPAHFSVHYAGGGGGGENVLGECNNQSEPVVSVELKNTNSEIVWVQCDRKRSDDTLVYGDKEYLVCEGLFGKLKIIESGEKKA